MRYLLPYPCECDFSDTTHDVDSWDTSSVIGVESCRFAEFQASDLEKLR